MACAGRTVWNQPVDHEVTEEVGTHHGRQLLVRCVEGRVVPADERRDVLIKPEHVPPAWVAHLPREDRATRRAADATLAGQRLVHDAAALPRDGRPAGALSEGQEERERALLPSCS